MENSFEAVVPPVGKKDKKPFPFFIFLVVVVVGLGIFTGLKVSGKFGSKPSSGTGGVISKEKITKGSEFGVEDPGKADTAMGVVEAGGIDGEGTHKLLREGGPSQTVYLTSSVIDMDSLVGVNVQIWGETVKAQKAGWLMDVIKVKVLD